MPGGTEIIVIAIVVIILFGAAAIPKFAKSLGQAKGEFEKGVREAARTSKIEESKDKEKEETSYADTDYKK